MSVPVETEHRNSTEHRECCPGEGRFCNNDGINKCELCDAYTCSVHGSSKYCNTHLKVMRKIDEANQNWNECYFGKCGGKPIAGCNFCSRLVCNLHRNEDKKCLRCAKALSKLQKRLKDDDAYEKNDMEQAKLLKPEHYKSWFTAKCYGSSNEFWYLWNQHGLG